MKVNGVMNGVRPRFNNPVDADLLAARFPTGVLSC